MLSVSLTFLTALLLMTVASAQSISLVARQDCPNNLSKCSPSGATATITPSIGSDLSSLYVNIVNSIGGVKIKVRDTEDHLEVFQRRAPSNSVCCAEGTLCLLANNLNLPFCYDKFTTNFYLPDGSYGSTITGNYSSPDGSAANLVSGNYTLANGTVGNLYGGNDAARPNTSTLSMPTPYTSAGVGSAIPASALGGEATYTTTIPGTTVEPTTVAPQTVAASVISGSTAVPATTKPATTIPGTTVAPKVLTITKPVSATGTTSATPSAKQNAGSRVSPTTTLFAAVAGLGCVVFTLFREFLM